MPQYRYQVRDRAGKFHRGIIEAPNEKMAAGSLEDRGFEIVALEESKRRWQKFSFLERVSISDFVIFARQLSTLIEAKVPLVQALKAISSQTDSKKLQKVIKDIADEVEAGSKLSLALSHHPKIFDNFFINMVKAGESSGQLGEVLSYLADEKEKDYELISKVRGAMIYPAFIICGMFAVGIVMMVFVIPQLTGILKESGAVLPWTTRLLIASSGFLQKYWIVIFVFLAVFIGGLPLFLKNPPIRLFWDRTKLRLPLFGPLFQKIYLVRFCRSLETLIRGGVDVVDALRAAEGVVQNAVYQDLIRKTAKEVEDGNSIIAVFETSALIPSMVTQMLNTGEETGRLTEILQKLTSFYTRAIENSVRNLVAIVEPLIMIIIGVAVGIIVSAIILPMYRLASQF